jgi:hypothetical protein
MDAIPDEQKCPSTFTTHQHIHKKLNYFLSTNKIPNIIFHGSTGSGKKTILYNLLDRIYCKTASGGDNVEEQRNIMKSNILYVNCCHGKGIKFIREELKFFAKMNIHHTTGVMFKTIVLFNADYLTTDAQSALRRCIELFSHNTRFFIIVENMDKLLNPIVSRFCQIYVPPLEYCLHRFAIPLHFKGGDCPPYDPLLCKFFFQKKYCVACYRQSPQSLQKKTVETVEPQRMTTVISENISETADDKVKGGNSSRRHNANYTKLFNYKSHKLIEHKHLLDTCLKELITITRTNGEGQVEKEVDTTLVEQLYDNGISALDILAYVKDYSNMKEHSTHPRFANEITKIEFFFHKKKGVFRCEKLLMFHLLWKINEIHKSVEPG